MKFIEEIVVEWFIPTVRSMLIEQLYETGCTQQEIAELLGISQSAVSNHLHGTIERHPAIENDDRVQTVVDTLAEDLAAGTITPAQALIEIEVLIRELEVGGVLASLHRDVVGDEFDLPQMLSIHDPNGRLRERQAILATLRQNLEALARINGYADLIPQVGSNLVYACASPESIFDIAGVPGRIVNVQGRTTLPTEPEFGVSEHVGGLLLAAIETGSPHRAAANIRYAPELLEALTNQGHSIGACEPSRSLERQVEELIEEDPAVDVIYHPDGQGIEANIYLFAKTPQEIVDTFRHLVTSR